MVKSLSPDFSAISDNGALRDPGKRGPHGEPVGIGAWAAEQGVPFAVPEWGVNDQAWGSTDSALVLILARHRRRRAAWRARI